MRQIKFRAWDTVNHVMKDWNYVASQFDLTDLFGNSRFIPLQYTGLKDKNGNEIYEGDCDDAGNVVEFSFGCWNLNGDRPLDNSNKFFIISGNKHQS